MNWDDIDLAIFDVDGTLYDQKRLRVRMMAELAGAGLRARSPRTLLILRAFRQVREELGDGFVANFAQRQYEIAAQRCGCSMKDVRDVVGEWIDQRPLVHLKACRLPGTAALFSALREAGKTIAVYSDYPARAKLAALDLTAHFIVSAEDEDVGRLKPDPAGLYRILDLAHAEIGRAVMIGDRTDRDGEAARRVGIRALIRSRRPRPPFETFRTYTDAPFQPLLSNTLGTSRTGASGRRARYSDRRREALP